MLELVTISEVITILTGLLFLRKGRPVFLYLILGVVIFATLNENIIIHHSMQWWGIARNVFYNVFSLVDMTVWAAVFAKIFSGHARMKKVITGGYGLIMLYSLLEIFVTRATDRLHTSSLMWWSAFLVILSLVYFSRMLEKDYHLFQCDPFFWLCAGAICFNAIFFVNLATMNDRQYWHNPRTTLIFDVLQCMAVLLYYSFICLAFIAYYYSHRPQPARQTSS